MKRRILGIALVFAMLLVTGCSGQQKLTDPDGHPVDMPDLSIGQAYQDALSRIEQGERVMLIELDGWGWYMVQGTKDRQPFLSGLNARMAKAAYPPISPVGLATLVTGQQPDAHGIHDRVNRQMKIPDIFQKLSEMGKTAHYVEGDGALIDTSLKPILSPDLNGENGTDDEVLENALQAPEVDFLMVHFHGIDDEATSYGPYSEQTTARMELVDGYVKTLCEGFPGAVIITADHGLHPVHPAKDGDSGKLGTHGEMCAEDMLVPYILFGGSHEEAK